MAKIVTMGEIMLRLSTPNNEKIIQADEFDINYGAQLSATSFQRDGKMRNGRAPENSYGKGKTHRFLT